MRKEFLIGVDIGTQGTKSAVFSVDGQQLGEGFVESKLKYPKPGWVEEDFDDIFAAAIGAIKQAVSNSGIEPSKVAAIGCDGQMAGIGGIDDACNPVTHFDSWLDTRCEPYVNLMKEKAGSRVFELTGCPPTYAHGPKILWWMNEKPSIFKKVRKFVMPSTYVVLKLCGLGASHAYIDYTCLHFAGFSDVQELRWSSELLDLFGVPEEKLPQIVRPWEVVGELSSEVAALCNLVPGIPIVAGAGDQAATSLGAGIVEPGMAFDVAGTASVLSLCTSEFRPDVEKQTVYCPRSIVPGLWIPIAYINGGGLCLKWFAEEIALGLAQEAKREGKSVYQLLDEQAAGVPPGAEGLVFVPHFGGRVCPYQPGVRGTWVGLNWSHSQKHMYRAILEGIAYEYSIYAEIYSQLFEDGLREVRVIGGGAKSVLWNQIKADVLNATYRKITVNDAALVGSAITAGYGVGVYEDMADAVKNFVDIGESVQPNESLHRQYMKAGEVYQMTIDSLLPVYSKLNSG